MHSQRPAGAPRPGTSHSRNSPRDAPDSVLLGQMSIPLSLDAPRAARAALERWTPASIPPTVLHDAQLLISELVSNSVEHAATVGGAPITVSAGTVAGVVWFDVADGGEGGVTRRPPKGNGGMGLNIVDAAASRWGTSDGDRTHVWFELAVRGP